MLVSKQRITGPNNGSSAYLLSLARTMREAGYDVWLVQPNPALAGRTPILRLSDELRVFARHEMRGLERVGDWAISLSPAVWWGFLIGGVRMVARKLLGDREWLQDRPRPYTIALPWDAGEHSFVAGLAQQAGPRLMLAVADYVFCTEAFADLPEGFTRAVIMHDLFSQRDGKGADSVAALKPDEEVALLARSDWIIAIQQQERDFAASACPESEAVLAAMPADIVTEAQPGEDNRLLFIGSDTAPNSVGLSWFFDEVWPLVRGACPNAELDVLGTVSRKFDTRNVLGVTFHGLVDDLDPFYRRAGVLVSPLTFGSGLKIKLVEALGQGKAVVATSITLQGVEDSCGPAVRCEDGAEEMAQAIIELLRSRPARLALAGRALACAREHFGTEAVHRELREKLLSLSVF